VVSYPLISFIHSLLKKSCEIGFAPLSNKRFNLTKMFSVFHALKRDKLNANFSSQSCQFSFQEMVSKIVTKIDRVVYGFGEHIVLCKIRVNCHKALNRIAQCHSQDGTERRLSSFRQVWICLSGGIQKSNPQN